MCLIGQPKVTQYLLYGTHNHAFSAACSGKYSVISERNYTFFGITNRSKSIESGVWSTLGLLYYINGIKAEAALIQLHLIFKFNNDVFFTVMIDCHF